MNDKKFGHSDILLGWPIVREFEFRKPRFAKLRTKRGGAFGSAHTVRYSGDQHLLTVAPTGAGKGVAAVIPTLLTYNGSAIVIDIKGENFYTTARYRRETLGQNIYLFDPFNHCKEPVKADIVRARLDPFKFIFGDGHANEADCQAAAQMLSMKSKVASGRDEWAIYWESLATELLAGLIYVIYNHRSGSTVDVLKVVFGDDLTGKISELSDRIRDGEVPDAEFAARAFTTFLEAREDSSKVVLTTLRSWVTGLKSEEVQHFLSDNSVPVGELVEASPPFTIYFVIPPNKLDSQVGLMRLVVGSLLLCLLRRDRQVKPPTLMLLDECAQLGELEELRRAITLMRGVGLKVWMFFQDLSQLERLYPDFETLVNNCGVFQSFGVSRNLLAEKIARLVGKVSSDAIETLHTNQQLLSLTGSQPLFAEKFCYFKDAIFSDRFDQNPSHRPASKPAEDDTNG